jgi:hypothetical protein
MSRRAKTAGVVDDGPPSRVRRKRRSLFDDFFDSADIEGFGKADIGARGLEPL